MTRTSLIIGLFGTVTVCLMALLVAWYIGAVPSWSQEAQEKDFQSKLAECDRLAELNGNDWRLKLGLDDTCVAVFEEYGRRIDEEEKRQAIDKAAAREIGRGQ